MFIFSDGGAVPMWQQRAGEGENPIFWDYHVVVVVETDETWVWDLDHRGPFPQQLHAYLNTSFPNAENWPLELQPIFRLTPSKAYRANFSSTRAHMLDEQGQFLQPPPPWDAIVQSEAGNWMDALDSSQSSWGPIFNQEQLQRRFSLSVNSVVGQED